MLKKIILAVLMFIMVPFAANANTEWLLVYKDAESVVYLNTITTRFYEQRDTATADVRATGKDGFEDYLISYEIDYDKAKMRMTSLRDLGSNKMVDISERVEKDWHSPYGVELDIFQKVEKQVDRSKKLSKKEKEEKRREDQRNRGATRQDIYDGINLVNSIDQGVRTIKRVLS